MLCQEFCVLYSIAHFKKEGKTMLLLVLMDWPWITASKCSCKEEEGMQL